MHRDAALKLQHHLNHAPVQRLRNFQVEVADESAHGAVLRIAFDGTRTLVLDLWWRLKEIADVLDVTSDRLWLGRIERDPMTHWDYRSVELCVDDGTVANSQQLVSPSSIPLSSAPGRIAIGGLLDGSGAAEWTLRHDGLTYPGVVLGHPGTGADHVAAVVASLARAQYPVHTVYLHASHPTHDDFNPDQCDYHLTQLEALITLREDARRCDSQQPFQPTPQRPLVMAVVPEADAYFRLLPYTLFERWVCLLTRMQHVGIAVVASMRDLAKAPPRCEELYERLCRHNLVAMGQKSNHYLELLDDYLCRPNTLAWPHSTSVGRVMHPAPRPFQAYRLSHDNDNEGPAEVTWRNAYPDVPLVGDEAAIALV